MTAEGMLKKAVFTAITTAVRYFSEKDDHYTGIAVGILVRDAVDANSRRRRIADVDAFLSGIKLGIDANFHRK